MVMEAAAVLAAEPLAVDQAAVNLAEARERAISASYATAQAAVLAPPPRLAEMIDAIDREATRMASGQRAALAIYGAPIDERILRDTVAMVAACEVLAAVRQNITSWPQPVQKAIARAMGVLQK